MTSYLRSIFGGQPATATAPGSSQTKSHHRSRSTPQNQNLSYIYAVPGTTPSAASSRPSHKRSNSYMGSRTTTPSPLRYTTYDTGSARTQSQASHPQPPPQPQQPSGRHGVPMYRSTSYKTGERPSPYPLYTPSVSFCSSRSNSSSSIHPGSSSGHPSMPPRTSSSGSVRPTETRPILKQHHTWHGGSNEGPTPHVSFGSSSRTPALHMHPLFASSRLHNAPISYDVTYTPSSRTVVDRSTHISVPAHTLSQPATVPPTLSKLILKSDKLPWPIIVNPAHTSSASKSAPRFYIATSSNTSKKSSSASTPISNLDVLYAVHNTLSTRITQEEWEQLGHGSRAQRKITRAYEKRCIRMGGGWEGGVRRIDWLGGKTRLVGIEVDKSASGTGKLVFGKA